MSPPPLQPSSQVHSYPATATATARPRASKGGGTSEPMSKRAGPVSQGPSLPQPRPETAKGRPAGATSRAPNALTSRFPRQDAATIQALKEAAMLPLPPVPPVASASADPWAAMGIPPEHRHAPIPIPERPGWYQGDSKLALEAREEAYFTAYLRDLHARYDVHALSFFEHNLEVWRQLWRVVEMSDVLLYTVDGRGAVLCCWLLAGCLLVARKQAHKQARKQAKLKHLLLLPKQPGTRCSTFPSPCFSTSSATGGAWSWCSPRRTSSQPP